MTVANKRHIVPGVKRSKLALHACLCPRVSFDGGDNERMRSNTPVVSPQFGLENTSLHFQVLAWSILDTEYARARVTFEQ